MKRVLPVLCAAALLLAVFGANAAAEDAANITKILRVSVKPGMSGPFEDALKSFMEARKGLGDPWQWNVFAIVEGPGQGDYLMFPEPHTWADYDEYFARDWSSLVLKGMRSISPVVESAITSTVMTELNLRSWPEEDPGFTLFHVHTYYIKQGMARDFYECIGKIDAARRQAGWEFYYLWQFEITGSDLPKACLVIPRTSWADFVEPGRSLMRVLSEVYGGEDAAALMAKFTGCVNREESYVAAPRRDLGLYPEK